MSSFLGTIWWPTKISSKIGWENRSGDSSLSQQSKQRDETKIGKLRRNSS